MNPLTEYLVETINDPNEFLVYELCPIQVNPTPFFYRRDLLKVWLKKDPTIVNTPNWFDDWSEWMRALPEGAPQGTQYTFEAVMEIYKKNPEAHAEMGEDGMFTIMSVIPRKEMMYDMVKFPKAFERATVEELAAIRAQYMEHTQRVNSTKGYAPIVSTSQSASNPPKPCVSCGGAKIR